MRTTVLMRTFKDLQQIDVAIAYHSITPNALKNKKERTKKRINRKKSDINSHFEECEEDMDENASKMYLTYQDAVLATIQKNVFDEPVQISSLIEYLQDLKYFDLQTQEYVHPQVISDQFFAFMVRKNPAISKFYTVIDDLVVRKE